MLRTSFARAIFILLTACSFFPNDLLHSQTRALPVSTSVRKSFLGGSYVLQVHNSSNEQLDLWLEAKEKTYNFVLPPGKTKDIGWAQGFRFDANDAVFISGNGYDTLKQAMPSDELSPWRIGFSRDGGLAINLSQSFLQAQLPKHLALPIKEAYPNIVDVAVTDIPQIVLKDGSDRIYANMFVHTTWFSGKARMPMNTSVSFVPEYDTQTGKIYASNTKVENVDIHLLPKDWANYLTDAINKMLPLLFGKFELIQFDKTLLKYAKFLKVRRIVVHDGRLQIQFF